MPRRRARRRAAFTLLELLVVATLAAALAALSWPAVRRSLTRTERQQAARELGEAIAAARQRAIVRGVPQLLRCDLLDQDVALFELRFDEASPERFAAAGPDGSRRPEPAAPPTDVEPPASSLPDANDPAATAGREAEDERALQAAEQERRGPELRLVERRTLPAGYRLARAAPEEPGPPLPADPSVDGEPLGTDDPLLAAANARGVDATAPGDVVRLVFDAAGSTADWELLLVGPDGFETPLRIDGTRGTIVIDSPRRASVAQAADADVAPTANGGLP